MSSTIDSDQAVNITARLLIGHFKALATSIRRLSSGRPIYPALNAAAGAAIRELMRTDIHALTRDVKNASDAMRAEMSAMRSRRETTIRKLRIQEENLRAAESRISDVNSARKVPRLTKNETLAKDAVSMLSQTKNMPPMLLRLISGPR